MQTYKELIRRSGVLQYIALFRILSGTLTQLSRKYKGLQESHKTFHIVYPDMTVRKLNWNHCVMFLTCFVIA
jgi:hypothetical protein